MPWLSCCHRAPKSKREDQYKVAEEPEEVNVEENQGEAMFSWERRPQMDIDKYRIHDLEGATEIRRGIAGQPMAIETCKNSKLLVLDHTSTITVDDCSDCLIVLAPCAGSVFLRDCQSCTVLVACQQLRTRDCRSLHIALHCATQPIIEETSDAIFHPLVLHYDAFVDDLIAARLSPFSRHSTSVHDFTPEKGSLHYKISREALELSSDYASVLASQRLLADVNDSDIPYCQEPFGKSHYFQAVNSDGEQRLTFVKRCQKVAQAVVASPPLRLVSTNEIDLQKHGSKLGISTKNSSTLVVLEVSGDGDVLEQIMTDGGFEKVPEHSESTFASSLAAINQIMLS
uniref:Protein XRP2 n=1 Tax=Haemonchus contortus TaxID=6289 RepID=A0A7I5EAN0_HAECO